MRHAFTVLAPLALLWLAWTLHPTHARSAPAARPAFGLDHLVHEGKISVMGGNALPCSRCHTIDKFGALVGAPDHSNCYGACHGPAPTRRAPAKRRQLAPAARRVCTRCHAPASVETWQRGSKLAMKPFYRPYSIQHDYGINLSHKKHDAPSRASGRKTTGCVSCHEVPGARPAKHAKQAPHARCASCHATPGKNAPPMTACASCHRAAYGPASRPNLMTGAFAVGPRFSHTKHQPRLAGGASCLSCHANIAASGGIDLAAPKTTTCATCHDGTRAFSTRGPNCRACHSQRDPKAQRTTPPRTRYSHQRHKRRGTPQTCNTCHTLDGAGEPRSAARDHAPCSDTACHASDFTSTSPTICGACHVAVEPWRPLHHDQAPRHVTEFGARFSHRSHLRGSSPRSSASCASCHKRRAAGRERALPRGHASCSGGTCHGPSTGAKPHLERCQACHALGIQAQRTRTRQLAPWSVRARFRHGPHTRTAKAPSTPLACTACHERITDAAGITAAPTPPKAACAGCHNGGAAFKLTGHGCWRCHAQRDARR